MIGKNLCFIIINEVLPTFKDKFFAGIQKGLGCQRSWEFLLKPYILVIKVYFFSNAKMSFEIISKWIGNSSWKNITRWHRNFQSHFSILSCSPIKYAIFPSDWAPTAVVSIRTINVVDCNRSNKVHLPSRYNI